MALAPDYVLYLVFGPQFTQGQSVDGLLALYAAMSGVYSFSVVLITYDLSRSHASEVTTANLPLRTASM
jgi:hypothetical protein